MTETHQDDQRESKEIRAVMLDYGLVLCRAPQQEYVDRIAAALRVDHRTFWRLYEKDRNALDKGDLTPVAYWRELGREAGIKLDAFTLQRLQNLDIEMWDTLEEPLLEWAHTLRTNGYKMALLSNCPLQLAEHLRKNRPWLGLFHVCLLSSELRLIKPDPAIFRLALQRLELKAPQVLFIDDRFSNITVARSLGIQAIQFTTLSQLNLSLRDAGFPYPVRLPLLH